ncbi:LppU/SCO3897 family protein [Actinophytocola glycyrrhizae]|uniref:Uncharacterized protein n=1 Tax=Actinophytocola glycyrrhizae TaxID=2044873 RepID=A0ABV9S3N2_9PSEU
MTTPPYPPGPHGQQPNDPYGQGGYGQQRPPQQPQYGQPQYGGPLGGANDQTQRLGGAPQNPYGGQYGATQQWPGAGYGGPTPPPPPEKKKTGMVVAIVVIALLVLGGAGAGLYFVNKDGDDSAGGGTATSASDKADSSAGESTGEDAAEETANETAEPGEAIEAQPGDCIKVNVASATNADVETVDCSAQEAIYRVATREETDTGSCPNDQYVSYTEEGKLLLCLQLNVSEGDCIEVSGSADKRADCAAPGVTHEVLDVLDGVDDETQCTEATSEVITYPRPPLTICLGSPTA